MRKIVLLAMFFVIISSAAAVRIDYFDVRAISLGIIELKWKISDENSRLYYYELFKENKSIMQEQISGGHYIGIYNDYKAVDGVLTHYTLVAYTIANESASAESSATPDKRPPKVVSSLNITTNQNLLEIETDEDARCKYGLTLTNTRAMEGNGTMHTARIALVEGTNYIYVHCMDRFLNEFRNYKLVRLNFDTTPPDKVEELEPKTTSAGDVLIKWKRVVEAVEYRIYKSKKKEGPFDMIANTSKNLWYDKYNLRLGETYYYKISAVDLARNEGETTLASVKIEKTPLMLEMINPTSDMTIETENIEVVGRTDPFIDVVVNIVSTKGKLLRFLSSKSDETGLFSILVPLDEGKTRIDVRVTNADGKSNVESFNIERKIIIVNRTEMQLEEQRSKFSIIAVIVGVVVILTIIFASFFFMTRPEDRLGLNKYIAKRARMKKAEERKHQVHKKKQKH